MDTQCEEDAGCGLRGSGAAAGRGAAAGGSCGGVRVGHVDTGAGEDRVVAAKAKGYDRHRGPERGAQPAALPGLHREAGLPQGPHRDLVRHAAGRD